MIDCKECVWEETCNAHRGGVIACPAGRRRPEARELPEAAIELPEATGLALVLEAWQIEQREAYRAAYGR